MAALNLHIMPHSLKSNGALYIYLCRHIPEAPKVAESIVFLIQEIPSFLITANSRAGEATYTNRKYRDREKPQPTFPTLNQPVIDFPHTSLNGCYSPICNSNEFHYKALEHTDQQTEREMEMLADDEGERGQRERKAGLSLRVHLSIVMRHLALRPHTQITAHCRAIMKAACCFQAGPQTLPQWG